MKVAPVLRALAACPQVQQTLVHTGQHYDPNMSDVFFRQLAIPAPDVNLEVGSGSHAVQTAQIMTRFEEVVLARRPDHVLVYGDVNSTVAAALVCAKLNITVDHVEAGLRSGDRTMPEEINRLMTDQIATLLFTPSQDGSDNLLHEGVDPDRIHCVGNVMIDTLVQLLPAADTVWSDKRWDAWRNTQFVLVTLHRPSNVDDPAALAEIIKVLHEVASVVPVLFPIHPRTRARMEALSLPATHSDGRARLELVEPLGYLEFLALQQHATAVVTDSGGIQEETTYLGVPCLTLRENTERPVTVSVGTNQLIGRDMDRLSRELQRILLGDSKQGLVPPLWDGRASHRIASVLTQS
jgi:UDP-N-acetylglucosamine 2-epimerase (non-hydrolysing)